jgi:hypothetical protein
MTVRTELLERLQSYKAHDLEIDDATLHEMAALCAAIGNNPSVNPIDQLEGRDLAAEVAKLDARPTTRSKNDYIERQRRIIRMRMAYLLSREIRFL